MYQFPEKHLAFIAYAYYDKRCKVQLQRWRVIRMRTQAIRLPTIATGRLQIATE